jgi:hypothetical protein
MGHEIRERLFFPSLRACTLNCEYSGSNPVLDLRYWNLLHAVCLSESSKTASIGSKWLRPLLNRVPLLPIVLSLLSNSLYLPAQRRDELYLQSSKSLAFLWSLAAPKFALDALLDCFGVVLRVIEKATASGEVSGLFEICGLVTSSLRTALSNVLNKKKVCLIAHRVSFYSISINTTH